MIVPALRDLVVGQAPLANSKIHGQRHWDTVARNARAIVQMGCKADREIVEIFALIHDSCRNDEDDDPDHGLRAAGFATELREDHWLHLRPREMKLLVFALRWHDAGMTTSNATVGACWDADRLDLGRVGERPNEGFLSTVEAKQMLRWGTFSRSS